MNNRENYEKDLKELQREIDLLSQLSESEMAYRRGYRQGFYAARQRPDVNEIEVYRWSHSGEKTAPPGSGFEGKELHGLTKAEEHRFFIKQLNDLMEKTQRNLEKDLDI